jgi:hypothetical protein
VNPFGSSTAGCSPWLGQGIVSSMHVLLSEKATPDGVTLNLGMRTDCELLSPAVYPIGA